MNETKDARDVFSEYFREHPLTDADREEVMRRWQESNRPVALPWDRKRWVGENVPRKIRPDIDREEILTDGQRYTIGQITGFRKDAVVYGPNGSGKSLVGWRVVADALEAGRSAACVTALEIVEKAKSVMAYRSPSEWLDENYGSARYGLLVIDEVAKRSGSDWETSLLQTFIDRRYEDEAQTVVIGNFQSDADAADSIGQSAFDRLTDVRSGISVMLGGKSFRRGVTG